jgi:dTDP-4-dehydrorhamnose 3,5-epimerase
MIFKKTKFKGMLIIEPEYKSDERGYFARIFCQEELNKLGINFDIAQINHSFNNQAGTIRGLHFQKSPKTEDKIVQCVSGAIYDVVVDLRKDSLTYGQWFGKELTEKNKHLFLVPKGFAHGFQTLTDGVLLQYFMSEAYSNEHASGVRWNDPLFNINWPLNPTVISEKDRQWPLIEKL